MKRSGFRQQSITEVKEKQAVKRAKLLSQPTKRLNTLKRSTVANLPSQTPLARKPRKKKSPLSKLKKQLWLLCREITIKRDGSDCYTCPSKALEGSNRQLGHFISSSICSTELRYDLKNLKIQCYSCNINKSGNWLAYENRLIREHGEDYVKELKERNEKTKGLMYREDFYIDKIKEYEAILASL